MEDELVWERDRNSIKRYAYYLGYKVEETYEYYYCVIGGCENHCAELSTILDRIRDNVVIRLEDNVLRINNAEMKYKELELCLAAKNDLIDVELKKIPNANKVEIFTDKDEKYYEDYIERYTEDYLNKLIGEEFDNTLKAVYLKELKWKIVDR